MVVMMGREEYDRSYRGDRGRVCFWKFREFNGCRRGGFRGRLGAGVGFQAAANFLDLDLMDLRVVLLVLSGVGVGGYVSPLKGVG
jgi:hypothetical protein